MEPNNLLLFYAVKRLFLFADEWLWYTIMIILLLKKYHKTVVFVFVFGFSCLYVSYHNIDLVERELVQIEQMVSPFDILYNYIINYYHLG